jgi:TPR repeat protein
LWAAPTRAADTRRAFLVGVQRYSDGNIQQLGRTVGDAKDLARDLEEIGFDKKNIKVVTDPRSKDTFDKEFNAFLKTVEPGDNVIFFFSGHGFGVEVDQTNYLLLGDLKSPFAYARSQMPDKDRKNTDLVRLKVGSYLEEYASKEIPKSGISALEIEQKLAERKPKTVIMILDACRSLVSAEGSESDRRLKRGDDSGSRLVTVRQPSPGFLILYSAAFGEQAVESFGANDRRRNSLFTEVLRSELQRPGQSPVELAERVKLMVKAIAQENGQQQEPEYAQNLANADDFTLIGSIGRERFQINQDKCVGGKEDWEQIKSSGKRELFERHRRRFDSCGTAELARRALVQLSISADDPIDLPPVQVSRAVNECDRLAASEHDRARPPEVLGVPFDKMDADAAIAACNKAIQDNPRVVRYLFNLGRAHQKVGVQPGADATTRAAALRSARLAYEDAAQRGYVSALNNLAILYENGDGVEADDAKASDLLKRAAQQGHPLAMYNLALHYRDGSHGIKRDFAQAYEWFAKSAESGFVSAMVELGDALKIGRGLTLDRNNPRRALEWYQRAADAGSLRAKLQLGLTHLFGSQARGDGSNSVPPDYGLALLWLARVADAGDPTAQFWLALMMEGGVGLPTPQPEIAERYWRLAAHGGLSGAQVAFAERLQRGFVLIKQEYGESEAVNLLQRAMSQGSPQAALRLAQIHRSGDLGQEKNAIEAIKLAYRTIELATQTDPTTAEGNPFHEIAAAHLLVEMAKNGEAVDAAGRSLLTQDEIERLERHYGAVDPAAKQVKIRRLDVKVKCGYWTRTQQVWVWDWGRVESPTEPQFRNIERTTGCSDNDVLRRTLIDIFEQAKKNKVPFADLIDQKIKTANSVVEPQRSRR